jgi:predicted kinase
MARSVSEQLPKPCCYRSASVSTGSAIGNIGVVLIVISGLPGTGKTTLAELVARRLGAAHLSVDTMEDALLGAGLEPGWSTGVAAYEAVRAAAEQNLSLGFTVVVDAVNDSDAARRTWREAAVHTGRDLRFVLLHPPAPPEHRRRLRARARGFRNVREPTWQEVIERAERYEGWPDEPIEMSASEPAERLVERLAQSLDLGT